MCNTASCPHGTPRSKEARAMAQELEKVPKYHPLGKSSHTFEQSVALKLTAYYLKWKKKIENNGILKS